MNFGNAPIEFATPLGPLAWLAVLGVPAGIVALYFLKLRRRPVRVPSTLLWRRSMEDLHVNSLFQRLRRNILLLLQLLAVGLAILALAGPRIRGTSGQGRRYVLAIDQSASMSATDVKPSRLDKAKEGARKVVDSMSGDDLAMVIAFADGAKVISNYTSNRDELRARIDGIGPTRASTSLREALQVAAGLANPSRFVEGVPATSIVAPKLLIYTDGGFADVDGFSLGNLEPEVVVIGPPPPPVAPPPPGKVEPAKVAGSPSDNVAILALQARRNDERPDAYQVFGRAHNYRADPVAAEARLFRRDPAKPGDPGTLVDAVALAIPGRSDWPFQFDLPDVGAADLEVRLSVKDAQGGDDRAYAVVASPRRARVLVVTPGNRYLDETLKTTLAEQRAEVVVATPDTAKVEPLAREAAAGRFDLVIYDRARPDIPPEANALYFGALPPGPLFEKSRTIANPVVLDWDVAHPLMQYIRDLSTIRIMKAIAVEPPPGSTVLIDSDQGPIAFATPRSGYVDAVVGFALVDGREFNTDWPLKVSFPLFLFNALEALGHAREAGGDATYPPAAPIELRAETTAEAIAIAPPGGGRPRSVARSPRGTFIFDGADATGIYRVNWPGGGSSFAVNQFDPREADLAPRGLVPAGVPPDAADSYKIKIGFSPVAGTARNLPARNDWWKPLAALALAVVLLEWYIYNRRVSL